MSNVIEAAGVRLVTNSAVEPEAAYGPELQAILNGDGLAAAKREIGTWPGYGPSPLLALEGLAAAKGLAGLWYKDEGRRFGLDSFKALGGSYAVGCFLIRQVAERTGKEVTMAALRDGACRDTVSAITVCTATDGNHGRSVAWGAQQFGCRCIIYIHAHVSEGRKQAMEAFGAEVRRVAGNYDDSVHQAAADAAANGWTVISDTSYPGYLEIPRDVMHGYMVMAEEAIAQLPQGQIPSHVFVQGGVGGLAAAVLATLWLRFGKERPRFVVVEPERAACLYESAVAGEPTVVPGALDTVMAGLAAGEVSLLAWRILEAGTDAFMTIPDQPALDAMRALADGTGGDPAVVAGESAVAGLAAALIAAGEPALTEALHLNADSRVLFFGTEGATDPELYREIVGRSAEAVRGEA